MTELPTHTSGGAAQMGEWEYAPPPTVYDLVRDNFLTRAAQMGIHLVSRFAFHLYYSLRVDGAEHVRLNAPCLITPNHSSHLDTIALLCALPVRMVSRVFSVAAKDYFFAGAVRAMAARLFVNGIPLDRGASDLRGLKLALKVLRRQGRIILYPEGTRTTTGEIGTFKRGAILLSRASRAPIVPTYIRGTYEGFPKGRVIPQGGRIVVCFGDPLRFWEGAPARWTDEIAAAHVASCVRALKEKVEKGEAPS